MLEVFFASIGGRTFSIRGILSILVVKGVLEPKFGSIVSTSKFFRYCLNQDFVLAKKGDLFIHAENTFMQFGSLWECNILLEDKMLIFIISIIIDGKNALVCTFSLQ